MRRACLLGLFLALACLWPSRVEAAITIVQFKLCITGGGVTSDTCSFNSTTGSGHLIAVMLSAHTQYATAVADDQAGCGGYTEVASAKGSNSQAWYCNSSVPGTQVITVTYAAAVNAEAIGLYEISGQATSNVVDAGGFLDSSSGNPQFGGSVTTVTAHTAITAIVCACGGAANITGIHAANPFTSDAINNAFSRGMAIASDTPTSTGTYQPEWDFDTNDIANASTVAWKEAGGGGPAFPFAILKNNPIRCCAPIAWRRDVPR